MVIELKKEWERDFEAYELFLKERDYFTNTDLKSNFLKIYQKIFLYTTLTRGICDLDKRSKIQQFFFECKNNMIISYDLANLNYINASKQILRSCIESFFRLSLGISRYIEYRENKKKGIYTSTKNLKNLRSMQDSHKVGKLTNFVINYYSSEPINNNVKELYDLYSELSGAVHVNDKDNFTPHRYLLDYSKVNEEQIELLLTKFEVVVNNVIIILYYFSFYLSDEGVHIHKIDLLEFERTLEDTSVLEQIENHFEKM
ncbi:hypothetical protein CQJ30_11065 [Caldibacillus thermoamylovorans]|uniref:hypothetical protein n=1 Tax=Caldibacillus thermoamylovorans TaxID=35841 RepID=UPI000D553111|nr:hypothetical protein [Caldibacillus thermoamylovorans]AWI12643.1 hypothetical protein CQJ30_11065 [Caldibacillus thermoamylovorans]